jgi:hypothetical protein
MTRQARTPSKLVNTRNSMELFRLSWHELLKWPILMLIEETGERIFLPDQPVISIGRLSEVKNPALPGGAF